MRPEPLREDLLAVLDDPSYRAAARRVGESFAAAGGAPAAADQLETLLTGSAGSTRPLAEPTRTTPTPRTTRTTRSTERMGSAQT